MELFQKAHIVRLRCRNDKYLVAEDNEESVCQVRDGSSKNAEWIVEFGEGENFIRLKSCYGKYLMASSELYLHGVSGRKIVQTSSSCCFGENGSTFDWEPLRDGFQVRLRTRFGSFLRPNGGLPPWRNSITHDSHSSAADKVLWDIETVEKR